MQTDSLVQIVVPADSISIIYTLSLNQLVSNVNSVIIQIGDTTNSQTGFFARLDVVTGSNGISVLQNNGIEHQLPYGDSPSTIK